MKEERYCLIYRILPSLLKSRYKYIIGINTPLPIHTTVQCLPKRFFSRADANEKAFSRGLASAAMQMWGVMTREAAPHNYIADCCGNNKSYITVFIVLKLDIAIMSLNLCTNQFT